MGSCVSSPSRDNPTSGTGTITRPQAQAQQRAETREGGGSETGADAPAETPSSTLVPTYPPTPVKGPSSAPSTQRRRSALLSIRSSSNESSPRRKSLGMSSRTSTSTSIRLNALRAHATLPSPSNSLPPTVLIYSNDNTVAIFDSYPKAKYHFLVLPTHPFPPQSDPESNQSIVKLDHLDSLQTLLLKTSRDVREQVITALANTAREVEEMIRDEMIKTEGFEWKIDVGFHAIPSMKHLHLHVISEDRISIAYKTKKHHNSFRPDLGLFVPLVEVQRWIQQDEEYLQERVGHMLSAGMFLDSPLTCFKCDEPFNNMPKLKTHLEKEFQQEKKKALDQIRRHGRQISSGEENDIF